MLVHCQSHLVENELFPEGADAFRFNAVTSKYNVSFVNRLDDVSLTSSTHNITTAPPANTGLAHNFKVACSPSNSYKKSIKIDAIIFTNFKEGKYWDAWLRNALAIARA